MRERRRAGLEGSIEEDLPGRGGEQIGPANHFGHGHGDIGIRTPAGRKNWVLFMGGRRRGGYIFAGAAAGINKSSVAEALPGLEVIFPPF